MGIVKIPGQLAPNGSFPVVDGNDIKGGFYITDTVEERNSISNANRKIGMLCYVTTQNMYYRLKDGITNECWTDLDLDNNGIIINNNGEAVKKDVILDIDHSHDDIHCTILKDEHGNKYHTQTNTDLVLTANNKTLTELLSYLIDKVEDTNDIPVESVKLDNNFLILKEKTNQKLSVSVLPSENTENLIWLSSDKNIVTVDNGVLTAINPGVAYIKVYSNKTRVSDVCSIVVSRTDTELKEVREGLVCDLAIKNDKTLTTWEDTSGNFNNAELIGFTNETEGGFKSDCLYLDGKQYIKLPTAVLNDDISTITLVADLLFNEDDTKVVKLFAKKSNYKEMVYQVNSEFISFGSNGVIKEYQKLNHLRGLIVYTFVINKITREIIIYINGRLYDVIKLIAEEAFGLSTISPLLIANNGEDQSSSKIKINRIKVFDRALEQSEILNDTEFLLGFFDGTDNNEKYCCSSGRWSNTYPCFSIEDSFYKKSYRYTRVNPGVRYRITLINGIYSGTGNANGYNQDKNKHVELSYLIYFNNGVAEFTIPNGVYFLNFYFKQNKQDNIYYILEEITELKGE